MKMHGIHEHVWDMFDLKREHGYILYSKRINASDIFPPKKNRLFNREAENSGFR